MTHEDDAQRIVERHPLILSERAEAEVAEIAAALAAAERRGIERAAEVAENFLVLIGAGWRKFPHNSSDGKARERMCVERIRALLPDYCPDCNKPAAKCGMGLTSVFVGTNGELPPQESHPVAKCATCGGKGETPSNQGGWMSPTPCPSCGGGK